MNDAPTVSIVVVNLDGRHLLAECLDSLAALDYPAERVDVIVVDNGSRDDSVRFLTDHYPHVRIVESRTNLGFAEGNNAGVRAATGELVALVNNDARVGPGWLRALVGAVGGDVACAGAKILDWEGRAIDFVGGALNLSGRAFQLDEGLPAATTGYDEPRELLFACGGAMLIRRDVFLDTGGFDPRFTAYFEDVDLGWRLWLQGHRVVFAPDALTYHRKHGTGGRFFPVERRYAQAEANALRCGIKNYEDATLWRVLPLNLMLGVKRALAQARLDTDSYRFEPVDPGDDDPRAGATEAEPAMTRVATSFLVAIERVADEMPEIMAERRSVQSRRRRTDAEVFERFPIRPDNPIFPWRGYHVTQDALVEALEVPEPVRPVRGSRLLIVTHEVIGPRMAGPGIRSWEIARALSQTFDVTLAARGEPALDAPGVRLVGFDPDDPFAPELDPHIAAADVVMAMGPLWSRFARLRDLGKPAIVDLYDPFELEKLAQSAGVAPEHRDDVDAGSVGDLQTALHVGDLFVCASDRQRDLWLGALLAAGRLNHQTYLDDPTLRSLIDVVGFGVPAPPGTDQPTVLKGIAPGIGADDTVLLWNGGLWPWFDPGTLLEALAVVVRQRPDVRLYFAAGQHFDPDVVPESPTYAETRARVETLGLASHVFFGDWIPYEERAAYLLEADLAVSTSGDTLESRFASRTRLLDCFWAGLPAVVTGGDPLATLIAHRDLGRVVPPGDVEALAGALLELLSDPYVRASATDRCREVAEELSWARQVEPIAQFLQDAHFAPDARQAAGALQRGVRLREDYERRLTQLEHTLEDSRRRLTYDLEGAQATVERQQAYIEALEAHVESIESGKVMRLMNALGRGEPDEG